MMLKDRKCYYILMTYLLFCLTEGENLNLGRKQFDTFNVFHNTDLTFY